MTETHTSSNAREKAIEDWSSRRSVKMHFGELYSTQPLVSEEGFYVVLSYDEQFCDAYNAETSRLLETHGAPDWAPKNRRPNQNDLQSVIERGVPIDSFKSTSRKISRAVQSRLACRRDDGYDKILFTTNEEKHILLMAFVKAGEACVVDAIDTLHLCWMGEFRIRKRGRG